MKIKKATRIEDSCSGHDGLEIEIEDAGETRTECFDDYAYWTQKENGEERFKTQLKENAKNRGKEGTPEKKTEIIKFKDVVL